MNDLSPLPVASLATETRGFHGVADLEHRLDDNPAALGRSKSSANSGASKTSVASDTHPAAAVVMAPRYAQSFSCNGAECPDICCSNWGSVAVDQKTVRIWEVTTLPGHTSPLVDATEVREGALLLDEYPRQIKRRPNSTTCSLLTADKLCSVHAAFGDAFLPTSCRYPRRLSVAGQRASMYLSPGCPQVAALALQDADAMDLVPMRDGIDTGGLTTSRRSAWGTASQEERANPDLDAVEATAELLAETARRYIKLPELNAWQAWSFYMASVIGVLEATSLAKDKEDAVEKIVALHEAPPDLPEILLALEIIERRFWESWPLKERLGAAVKVAQTVKALPAQGESKLLLSRAMAGLGLENVSPESIGDDACAAFMQATSQWGEPFDEKNPHLAKNFLLNRLGLANFPQGGASKLISLLTQNFFHLEMIRVFLAGLAAAKGRDFGTNDYVAVVQAYSRHAV